MRFLDKTLESFGFTQDTTIVAIICIVVLLGNFAGGMMANILIAFGGPIEKRKLTEREVRTSVSRKVKAPSSRLAPAAMGGRNKRSAVPAL